MPNPKQICLASVLVCALFSTAAAQESSSQRSTLTITVAAAGERVRITAPSSVVQMHVEVYAAGGEKLFDQEIRGGNVFDWHLQDGQAQRLAAGAYVCVVTAKTISGKLTQKIGAVTVAENSASVQPGNPQQLSLPQTQAIGPVEADSSWIIAGQNEPQTPTVIANDGTDAQMIRGRGALTFRIGNFFSGIDTEQMRLTEAGDLGIGTSTPRSKLDVAGAIRAERFLVVKPKLAGGDKTTTGTAATDSIDSVQPLVSGSGTSGRLTKWTDNSGALGDSLVTELGTNLGIGTTNPAAALHVRNSSGVNALTLEEPTANQGATANFQRSDAVARQFLGIKPTGATGVYDLQLGANSGLWRDLILTTSGADNGLVLKGANGFVGIGTTNPAAALHVRNSSSVNVLTLEEPAVNQGATANFQRSDAVARQFLGIKPTGATGVYDLQFGVNSGLWRDLILTTSGADNGLVLKGINGNVGIGTSTPAAKLDVLGNINTLTQYNIGGNRILGNPGVNNLFAGVGAGNANTSGNNNTFVGREAGFNNIIGVNNSFFGRAAGVSNTGSNNTFMGLFSGLSNTEGSNNSFIGSGAGIFSTEGSNNSFFGSGAGQANTTGSYNTIIGANANVGAPNLINATAIGAGAVVNNSFSTVISGDEIVLDGVNVIVPNFLKVQGLYLRSGIATVGGSVCHSPGLPDGYSAVAPCVSSRRYKTNIARLGFGLDLVRRLRPITFDWKEGGMHDLGLIAEDVAAIEPLLVTYDSKGQVEGVKYDRVGVLLVNAVQEQQQQIAALQTRLRRLEQALMNRPEAKRRHR